MPTENNKKHRRSEDLGHVETPETDELGTNSGRSGKKKKEDEQEEEEEEK
jgi:hypothetical protein